MTSVANDILNDLAETLRSTGELAMVSIGPMGSNSAVPSAEVLFEGRQIFPADDTGDTQWVRLEAEILVRTRAATAMEGITRTVDLSETLADALMEDPYRDGLCGDLPIGLATEIKSTLPDDVRAPAAEIRLAVKCHYEQVGGGA
ncbi:MAG: hypothetical protein K8S55_03210 [Phycisphaerae bacterium]|nr:hypothetical protein [Phycisphaerae bacterium]